MFGADENSYLTLLIPRFDLEQLHPNVLERTIVFKAGQRVLVFARSTTLHDRLILSTPITAAFVISETGGQAATTLLIGKTFTYQGDKRGVEEIRKPKNLGDFVSDIDRTKRSVDLRRESRQESCARAERDFVGWECHRSKKYQTVLRVWLRNYVRKGSGPFAQKKCTLPDDDVTWECAEPIDRFSFRVPRTDIWVDFDASLTPSQAGKIIEAALQGEKMRLPCEFDRQEAASRINISLVDRSNDVRKAQLWLSRNEGCAMLYSFFVDEDGIRATDNSPGITCVNH